MNEAAELPALCWCVLVNYLNNTVLLYIAHGYLDPRVTARLTNGNHRSITSGYVSSNNQASRREGILMVCQCL